MHAPIQTHVNHTNYAASSSNYGGQINNVDSYGNNYSYHDSGLRTTVENLLNGTTDILQLIFLVFLSCSDTVSTNMANSANIMTQLKGVSGRLTVAAQGLQSYYTFLTRATQLNKTDTTSTLTDYQLNGAKLFGTFYDAAGNSYDLSALKTALNDIGGANLTSTSSAADVKAAMTAMAATIHSDLVQVNAGTNSSTTTDDGYFTSIGGYIGKSVSTSVAQGDLGSYASALSGDLTSATNSAASLNTTNNAELSALEAIYQQIFTSSTNVLKMAQDMANQSIAVIGQ